MNHLSKSILFGLALSVASGSYATALQVAPVHVHAEAHAKTGAIQLINPGQEPVVYQASVLRWTQVNGKDVFEPTQDVLASPVMVKIGSGEKKAMRFSREVMDSSKSEYYKLKLQEVPVAAAKTPGVSTIPVFALYLPMGFEPKGAGAHLKASMAGGKLLVSNDGQGAWSMSSIGKPGEKPWKEAAGWILPDGGLAYDMPVKPGDAIEVKDGSKTQTLVVQ